LQFLIHICFAVLTKRTLHQRTELGLYLLIRATHQFQLTNREGDRVDKPVQIARLDQSTIPADCHASNVIFAAAISPNGPCSALFELASAGYSTLLTSPHALEETRRNITAKYPEALTRLERDLIPEVISWCKKNGIEAELYDSVVNKTPLSSKTNKMIGGNAPSVYLSALQKKDHMMTEERMNELLLSHVIDPVALRADNFEIFFQTRHKALLERIEQAMGKKILSDTNQLEDAERVEYDEELDN